MNEGMEGSPLLALNQLDPKRITFARELQALTKKELAGKIGKTPSAVTQFEQGTLRPDLETFVRISLALGMPPAFFARGRRPNTRIKLDACNFRALRAATQRERRQSTRIGELILELMGYLEEQGVVFPKDQVTPFTCPAENCEEVEQIASELRRQWGMGFGPIPNIVKLLESKGVFVLPIYEACERVDAFSTWAGTRPCVMLAYGKKPSRARFDAGHELGHLILHEDAVPDEHNTESEAFRFAGAFLAPREGFLQECPRQWSLAAFKMLKFRWKMSIAALVRRAYDLGKLSQSSYRRANMDINRRGMKKDEGQEWDHEEPTLLAQALRLLQERLTLRDLAAAVGVHPDGLKDALRRCVSLDLLQALDREPDEGPGEMVRLRVAHHESKPSSTR